MKKALIVLAGVVLAVGLLFVGLLFLVVGDPIGIKVDYSFATSAHLKYIYDGNKVDVEITDPDDVAALRTMLTGRAHIGHPACMFTPDFEMILRDGRRRAVFHPSICTPLGDTMQIGDSDRYISLRMRDRKRFQELLNRYHVRQP